MEPKEYPPPVRKPIQVSKAPSPITPLSGRGSYRPPAKPPTTLLDWNHWRLTGLEPWQAAALTLNVNPDDMHWNSQAWMSGAVSFTADSFQSLEVQNEFTKRLSQINANLHNNAHFKNRELSLTALAAWCVHAGYDNPPPALMAFFSPASPPAPVQNTATPAPVVTASDGPAPLTRNEIANCFAGLRGWDVKRWKSELSSPDDWLKACQQCQGTRGRGGYESTWWPVRIAGAMVEREDTTAKLVSARFKNQEPLKPWLDTWQTYHPDNA